MPVTQFYRIEDERKNYIFRNKPVQIQRENGLVPFPCIALYRKGAVETPVWYPRYERWYIPVDKAQIMAATTLRKRSTVICAFLNYMLWNTNHSYLHDITMNDIRQFFLDYQTKENGQPRSALGWNEGVTFVADFLASYYNDLTSRYPSVAEEWHPAKNRKRTPTNTVYVSTKKVWWKCSKCGHEWYASVRGRTLNEIGCPKCREAKKRYQ